MLTTTSTRTHAISLPLLLALPLSSRAHVVTCPTPAPCVRRGEFLAPGRPLTVPVPAHLRFGALGLWGEGRRFHPVLSALIEAAAIRQVERKLDEHLLLVLVHDAMVGQGVR